MMSSMIIYNGQKETCDRKYRSNAIVLALSTKMFLSVVESMGIASNLEKKAKVTAEK